MTKRSERLLKDLETGALDHKAPIGDLLRTAIALGGEAGSTELRDWAIRELRGYGPGDELPPYRKVVAPIQMDLINARFHLTGQTISPAELPDFAQDAITNDVNLYMAIAEIEDFSRRCAPGQSVKIAPAGAQELVAYMNAKGLVNGHIERMYWALSPVSMDGVVDQVRTALTILVAEIHASVPDGTETPSAEVTSSALAVAVSGKRNRVTVTAPQGASRVTTQASEPSQRHWVKTAAAIVVGLLTIAGVVFALMQAQGWSF